LSPILLNDIEYQKFIETGLKNDAGKISRFTLHQLSYLSRNRSRSFRKRRDWNKDNRTSEIIKVLQFLVRYCATSLPI